MTTTQLAALNQKYPSDPAYYYRTILGLELKRAKVSGQSVYFTPEQFAVWQEGQKKEAEQKKAEQKEAIQPSPAEEAAGAAA